MNDARETARSAVLWMMVFTVAIFLFLIFAARPVLRMIGTVLSWMGGPGLEGTGL